MLVVCLMGAAMPAWNAGFRVGRAAVGITPPVGMPMAGSYAQRLSKGVHDELYAKALVIEKDGEKAVLVVCDTVSVPRPVVEETRRRIAAATGIPGERVMISATHTHSGPLITTTATHFKWIGGELEVTREYLAGLPGRIAESVRQADAELAPARAAAAIALEDGLSINRRWLKRDGSIDWDRKWYPEPGVPDLIRPLGPIDPDVAVVFFESAKGDPLLTYVNFAMHAQCAGGLEFSADYPYALGEALKARGAGMLTMFSIGAAGNINPVHLKLERPLAGHPRAARIGTILAANVLKAYARLQPVTAPSIRVRSELVRLPLAEVAPAEVEPARQVAARFGKPDQPPFLELVNASKVLDVAAREGRPLEAEVQVVALGREVAWVAIPGEYFAELGIAIKRGSPYPYTVVVELANGSIGYIPNRKAYGEGHYEAVSARCAPGSGEALAETATRLLIESYRDMGGKQ
jgi:hypothetical protein